MPYIIPGDKFDQAKWDALEKDTYGKVSKATFMALVPASEPPKEEAPKEEPPKEEAPKEEAPPAVAVVVKCPMTGLPAAVDAARAAGLTPLIVDRSENHLLDTFHQDKADSVLDAKMVSLEVAKKNKTKEDGQQELRKKLGYAMARGFDMFISCQQASPSFSSDLCCDVFPVNLFEKSGSGLINDASAELIIPDDVAAEATQGMKLCSDQFKVQVTSHFAVADLDDFFFAEGMGFGKMPKAWFQIIELEHDEGTPMLD